MKIKSIILFLFSFLTFCRIGNAQLFTDCNPLSRPNDTASRDWIGLYLTDKWMTNTAIRDLSLSSPFIRGLSLEFKWGDIQPTGPDFYDWSTLDTLVAMAIKAGKYLKFNIRGTDHTISGRIPAWAEIGIATVPDAGNDPRIVLWDSLWCSRWATFIQALGARYWIWGTPSHTSERTRT